MKIPHPHPLRRARIISRPNRFIVWAELEGTTVKCHCPVSGRIGGLTLDGLPCLLSGPHEGRGTAYTVEAFALEEEGSATFQWIGLNQSRCNSYVESLLKTGQLSDAFPEATPTSVRREKKLNDSRIDFLIADSTFVEVKMPLLKVHAKIPPTVPLKVFPEGNPSERLPKQMSAMVEAIGGGLRGAMLVVFQYANTAGTSLEEQLHSNIFPDAALTAAKAAGLEQWVCVTNFTEESLTLQELVRV